MSECQNSNLVDVVYSLTAYKRQWDGSRWINELIVNQQVTRLSFTNDRPTTDIDIPGGYVLQMTTGFLSGLIYISYQLRTPFDLGGQPASGGYVQCDQYDGFSPPMKSFVHYATPTPRLQIQVNLTHVNTLTGKPEELAMPDFGLEGTVVGPIERNE
jgi:hypothetical protein